MNYQKLMQTCHYYKKTRPEGTVLNGTLQFAINDYAITIVITENTITDQIANCRNRSLSAIHDLKNYTISQEKLHSFSPLQFAEIGHFLQFKISMKTIDFSQEKLYSFF